MAGPVQEMLRNRLLRAMAPDDYALIRPHLEPVPLDKDQVLFEAHAPIAHVYFAESGLTSVVAFTPEGKASEIGLSGYDGMAGVPVVLASDRGSHKVFMQVAGEGHRLPADALRAAMAQSETLRSLLLRYAFYFLTQVGQTAASNAQHTIEERLGRWILMSHDRMLGDDIPLTHDYLALMLAVRRPSVTTALHVIEGLGYIRATRGRITMRNRAGLEELAGDAYGLAEAEYARLVAPLR